MFTLLVPCLALSLGADNDGKLEIVNARPTYGYLGASRPKTGSLPGETLHFAFDIKGLKLDENARASYSVAIEVRDPKGLLIFEQKPYNRVAQSNFGGNTFPCAAHLEVPIDATPGDYHFQVTIQDRLANKAAKFAVTGKVLPLAFGLVQVGTFADREGNYPVPPLGAIGESLYVNFSAVGFACNKDDHQPDLKVSLRIFDDQGKPTLPQPLTGRVNCDVPKKAHAIPMHFGLTLNRAGHYTIELSASDEVAGKTAKVSFPVRILAPE